MYANPPEFEFHVTKFESRKRNIISSLSVYVLHKTRRSRAKTAKKCTKKRDARTKLLFCLSTYYFFRRSRCRQKRRERFPTLKAMQERNLCLQGRMGRFSEWSSVSFNVTITNYFGAIERFGITLTN